MAPAVVPGPLPAELAAGVTPEVASLGAFLLQQLSSQVSAALEPLVSNMFNQQQQIAEHQKMLTEQNEAMQTLKETSDVHEARLSDQDEKLVDLDLRVKKVEEDGSGKASSQRQQQPSQRRGVATTVTSATSSWQPSGVLVKGWTSFGDPETHSLPRDEATAWVLKLKGLLSNDKWTAVSRLATIAIARSISR